MSGRPNTGDRVEIVRGPLKGCAGVIESVFSRTVAVRRSTDTAPCATDIVVVGFADVEAVPAAQEAA